MSEIWRGRTEVDGDLIEVRVVRISPGDLVVLCCDERYPDGYDRVDSSEIVAQVFEQVLIHMLDKEAPVIELEDKCFHIGDKAADPTLEDLADLFEKLGFTSDSTLKFDPSMDFPERAGLPADFDARALVQEALKLL